MSIKLSDESYVSGPKEIEVPNGESPLKLYVHELGYLKAQQIYITANNDKKDALTALIVESIKDKDGNQFTYDEALSLKKPVSEALLNAVLEVNGAGDSKN